MRNSADRLGTKNLLVCTLAQLAAEIDKSKGVQPTVVEGQRSTIARLAPEDDSTFLAGTRLSRQGTPGSHRAGNGLTTKPSQLVSRMLRNCNTPLRRERG